VVEGTQAKVAHHFPLLAANNVDRVH